MTTSNPLNIPYWTDSTGSWTI